MYGVPGGIDPGHLVGEKFQDIKRARDPQDERVAEHCERLVIGPEHNPMQVNCETSDEDRQVKVNAGQAGKTQGNAEQLDLVHAKIMRGPAAKSRPFGAVCVCDRCAPLITRQYARHPAHS